MSISKEKRKIFQEIIKDSKIPFDFSRTHNAFNYMKNCYETSKTRRYLVEGFEEYSITDSKTINEMYNKMTHERLFENIVNQPKLNENYTIHPKYDKQKIYVSGIEEKLLA